MKRYAEYKESGIEWIGEIPKEWEVIKLRNIGDFSASGIDKLINKNEEIVRIINYVDVYGNVSCELREKDYMQVTAKKEKIIQHQVIIGDLIFTPSSETVDDIGVSALVVEDLPNTAYSYHVLRFRFKKDVVFRYRKYMCNNYFTQKYFSSRATGSIRKTLNREDFKETPVVIPPLLTQQLIADYLDRKTTAIDSLIADKQNLVELLKEKRNAVISEAVTTGLDKTVKMKDSGIDWIGKIPEDYEILPLFAVASENKIKNIGNICDNLLSLSYGNIIRKDINTNDGLLPESFETYQIVDEGYTVLRLTDLQNDKRSLRTGYVNERGIITSAYVGLIPSERIDGIYLSNLLHGYDLMKIFYALGNGVRQSMKYADLKRLAIVVPPIEKQKEISAFLVRKTAEIDSLISDINEQIKKLKEYRQSVISEVVAGKVAV